MRRRDLLRSAALTVVGASMGRGVRATETAPETSPGPAGVISTWNFGATANAEAERVLAGGGSALDAVERGVRLVEADPEVTSVGFGGIPNRLGVVELDAAIMDGRTREAGAVAGLQGFMHPISVARAVMVGTEHVLLVGEGARRFALERGFKEQDLLTPASLEEWKRRQAAEAHDTPEDHDTIGLIARAADGTMAVACTTSGLALKLPGRVGDSPLIGHGLYCDDEAGGATATGVGEEVIKVCGSYQVVEFMRQGLDAQEAVERVLKRVLRRDSANRDRQVGFVALRADGQVGYGSTIPGFEAAISRGGKREVVKAQSLVGG
jgi:N4-(beta-N-acetylglucosaminyl)-L-asparaginase